MHSCACQAWLSGIYHICLLQPRHFSSLADCEQHGLLAGLLVDACAIWHLAGELDRPFGGREGLALEGCLTILHS